METVPDKPEKSYSISASYGNSSQQVVVQISACMDADKDGFFELNVELKCSPADCDDRNFFVNPAAKEICDDIDNNCNGLIDENISCPDFVQPDETENSGTGDRNITSLMIAKGVSIESIGFVRLIYIGLLICLAIFAIASYFVVKRL
ncbi:MAG: putative metal-binding motif-containing protein [Candidatus Aenigmarchaeota archaeon]|nr:putative metal-binding motif-containing protein [Candidatus Aenigmarchaeota archaeon]